ncbi:hypothetical protein CDAR_453831 [Caerostris darwini]|uniref:Uncharacterized protein n=1 Tax=Caerostris darwini TaxID=1538125 RepID=A0AAV4UCV9_9ARAC|nr:hypothetical protein CDAR_453831 [Caerostris darwini]
MRKSQKLDKWGPHDLNLNLTNYNVCRKHHIKEVLLENIQNSPITAAFMLSIGQSKKTNFSAMQHKSSMPHKCTGGKETLPHPAYSLTNYHLLKCLNNFLGKKVFNN